MVGFSLGIGMVLFLVSILSFVMVVVVTAIEMACDGGDALKESVVLLIGRPCRR